MRTRAWTPPAESASSRSGRPIELIEVINSCNAISYNSVLHIVCMCVCTYIHIPTMTYIYIYIERERDIYYDILHIQVEVVAAGCV